jgi:diguanylate cyclase (GGDEF)-like protein
MMKFVPFLFLISAVLSGQTLTFGVFSYRTPEKILKEYQPIADHIARELKMDVILKPLSQEELEQGVSKGEIDVIATNPTHYLSLQKQRKTTGAIATMVKRYGTLSTPYLGGVIITRSDNGRIRSLGELRGKKIAIPGKKFLGGYQTQAYTLSQAGIDVTTETVPVVVKNHNAVVNAVLARTVDAGFIRSGILEDMIRNKKLEAHDIFVLHEQKFAYFPLKISTDLYPEWAIAASKKLNITTVSKIAIALYGYKDPKIGDDIIAGFTIPGDYANIDTLARTLRIPPYDTPPSFTLKDIWEKYGIFILIFSSLLTLFVSVLGVLYRKAKLEQKYAKSILNTVPAPIIVTDGTQLIDANTAFLRFVEFDTVETFKNNHHYICDLFEEGDTSEYLHAKMNDVTWIGYIIEHPEKDHKVKITINGITHFFKVNVSMIYYNEIVRYIAIFDDISQLITQSITDPLTAIANRTHFNLLFKHTLYVAQREHTPLSLIFFDIDHFKVVNDTYGHLVGDDVLRHLANITKNSLRKSDIIARWGGEEFIIVLPNTSLDSASLIAQTLRKTIENEPFAVVQHVTCSFGVAQLQEGEEGEKLILRLDELLYRAKENGRNRVEAGVTLTASYTQSP